MRWSPMYSHIAEYVRTCPQALTVHGGRAGFCARGPHHLEQFQGPAHVKKISKQDRNTFVQI